VLIVWLIAERNVEMRAKPTDRIGVLVLQTVS
jgi:hypothetical protein